MTLNRSVDCQMVIDRNLIELQIFHEISSFGLNTKDENDLIGFVVRLMHQHLFSEHFGVLLWDEVSQHLFFHPSYIGAGLENLSQTFRSGEGIVGKTIEAIRPIRVTDTRKEPDYLPKDPESRMLSQLCVPMIINGKALGVINAESPLVDSFSDQDEKFLTAIANNLSMGIERLRLMKKEQQRSIESELLETISGIMVQDVELESVLEAVLKAMKIYLDYDNASIFLSNNGALRLVANQGPLPFADVQNIVVNKTDALFELVSQMRSPLILEDASKDSRFQDYGAIKTTRGWMGIPLRDRDEVIGYVTFDSNTPGKFTKEVSSLAHILVNQVSGAIVKAGLFAKTNIQLERLKTLNAIEKMISSNLDISFTLGQFLKSITEHLGVSAAAIMRVDHDKQTLSYRYSYGFNFPSLKGYELKVGEGYPGRVALTKEAEYISGEELTDHILGSLFKLQQKTFQFYCCLPLIAKDVVTGVLEIFDEHAIHATDDYQEFLMTLASQAALAIENSDLFEEFQKSNLDISLAYDATLEGWAKTLELRDQETQGHSARVVEMTVKVARSMGLSLAEIIHARRGALLHDIGKIGIPDDILQKTGPLTDEQWVEMKKHPGYAHEALKDIEFLKPALEIPYLHHERWDGSGYPLGLVGDEIPLAARIFAVVDVYDALTSDRPYRRAWSQEKTLDYIKEESGKQFDPDVVEAFFQNMKRLPV